MTRFKTLILLAVHLPVAILSAQSTADNGPVDSRGAEPRKARVSQLRLPLDFNSKTRSYKAPERITPSRPMSAKIEHFNFVFYEPVVSIEAKPIPGYELLEKLWAQVLNIGPAGSDGVGSALLAAQSPFLAALEDWRAGIRAGEIQLKNRIAETPRGVVFADSTQRELLKERRNVSEGDTQGIEKLRAKTEALILRQFAPLTTKESDARAKEYLVAKRALDSLTHVLDSLTVVNNAADKLAAEELAKTAADRKESLKKAQEVAKKTRDDALASVQVKAAHQRTVVDRFGVNATLTTSPIEEAYYAQSLYDSELERHNAITAKFGEFIRRADETLNGRVIPLDKQKAGTIVTVTAKPKPLGDSPADAERATKDGGFVVSYYVQSSMPLVFHAGAALTDIKSFDYQVVQKSLTGDVFQRISQPEQSADLIAFMTYLPEAVSETFIGGVGLTIGTGLKDLGKRLYLGASARFTERFLFTGGAFSQTVTENDGNALSTNPDLFAAIKRVEKWGWFVSFSATPF